jgi:Niemann-Pick C1 protein
MLTLATSLQTPEAFLYPCPACWDNFERFWCTFTCSPYQGYFVQVTQTTEVDGVLLANATNIVVDRGYADAVYENCVGMKYQGGPVMVYFGGATDAPSFFRYQGVPPVMPGSPGSPYLLTFDFPDKGGMALPTNSCSESCACVFCQASCSYVVPPEAPHAEDTVTLGRLHLSQLELSMSVLFAGACLVVLCVVMPLLGLCKRQKPQEQQEVRNITTSDDEDEDGKNDDDDDLVPDSLPEEIAGPLERHLRVHFRRLGMFCARRPWLVIGLSCLAIVGCGHGLTMLEFETDPATLWTPPNSRAARDERYFNGQFGPFYRIENILVRPAHPLAVNESMFSHKYLDSVLLMAQEIWNISVPYRSRQVTLQDICYRPTLQGCLTETPLAFFWLDDPFDTTWYNSSNFCGAQPDNNFDYGVPFQQLTDQDIQAMFSYCGTNPSDKCCRSKIGVPLQPIQILGGYPGTDYMQADTLVITYLTLNDGDEAQNMAAAWEQEFLRVVQKPWANITVTVNAQRSAQDELARETMGNVPAVAGSYCLMFAYVTLALGGALTAPKVRRRLPAGGPSVPRFASWLGSFMVGSKGLLGLSGIVMVLCSIVVSFGVCSYARLKATLIISEVIPFLVLAIGVDNLFLLVNEFRVTSPGLSVEERMGETLANVGTSIFLAALCETFAFLLGWLTYMPAVQAFAVYAAVAVFADFLLQVTCFVSLLALDARRELAGRLDCIPLIVNQEYAEALAEDAAYHLQGDLDENLLLSHSQSKSKSPTTTTTTNHTALQRFFHDVYAPALMHRFSRVGALLVALGLLCAGTAMLAKVELGLPQQEAFPQDSYLIPYFDWEGRYLKVGPPGYLVVKSADFSRRETQNLVCSVFPGAGGCSQSSMASIVSQYSRVSNTSYIATVLTSWLDDYLLWLNIPACLPSDMAMCPLDSYRRPTPDALFGAYLPAFQETVCSITCPYCGEAYLSDLVPLKDGQVVSRFRFFHSVLSSQSDYITALREIYAITDTINRENPGIEVVAYSIWYVYFQQYLEIVGITATIVALALAAVFAVSVVLLWDPVTAAVITATVAAIQVDLLGLMYLWGISLNAVSATNIVMSIGISVEFCVHIARAFTMANGTRAERARKAIAQTGASVFAGIAMTKLLGVSILAAAPSKIFQIFFFRMYLMLVLLASFHGLVVLPVLLSLVGGGKERRK